MVYFFDPVGHISKIEPNHLAVCRSLILFLVNYNRQEIFVLGEVRDKLILLMLIPVGDLPG